MRCPLTLYGPSGLRELLGRLAPRLRKPAPTLSRRSSFSPGDVIERADYTIRPFAVDHGRKAVGYLVTEAPRPGRFDVAVADALGVPPGRERGQAAARGGRRPGQRRPRSGRSRSSVQPAPAAPWRSPATRRRRRPWSMRSRASTCSFTRRRSAPTSGCAPARRSTRRRPRPLSRRKEAGVRLLALTHISSRYFGGEAADEARQLFPDDRRPARLRHDRDPVPRARRTRPRSTRRPAWTGSGPFPTHERRQARLRRARPASTTRCDRPTRPGGRPSPHSSSSATSRGRRVLDVGCGTGRLAARS